jgi:hypothetical protein
MSKCGFTKFRNLLLSPIVSYVLFIHVFCLVLFLLPYSLYVENKAEALYPACGCSSLLQYLPLAVILQNLVSDMSQKLSIGFCLIPLSARCDISYEKQI